VKNQPIYPFFLSRRGCRSHCVYCRQEIHLEGDRHWSAATARQSLEAWLPDCGRGEIAFYGGSFTLLSADEQLRYLSMANEFVAAGRAGGIRFSTHPAGLGADHLALLRDWPVSTIEVGCQSFSDAILQQAQRGHSSEQTLQGIARLRELPLRFGLQLMPGLPGGDAAEAIASLERALEQKPAFVRFYPTVVLPETPLAKMVHTGSYRPWSLDEAVGVCADMLLRCLQAGVPVARIGLPPLEVPAVGGPWHPALGQLVVSRLWRRALTAALQQCAGPILVPRASLSDAFGHSKSNLNDLQGLFGQQTIAGSDALADDSFTVGSTLFSWREMAAAGCDTEVHYAA